jgi:import inner membrane translocase subunit TIM23
MDTHVGRKHTVESRFCVLQDLNVMAEHLLRRPLALASKSALRQSPRQQLFVCRTYASAGSSHATAQSTFSWREYLAIRASKRKWQVVRILVPLALQCAELHSEAVTIPCAFLGFAGGVAYFGTRDTDPTKSIMVCSNGQLIVLLCC